MDLGPRSTRLQATLSTIKPREIRSKITRACVEPCDRGGRLRLTFGHVQQTAKVHVLDLPRDIAHKFSRKLTIDLLSSISIRSNTLHFSKMALQMTSQRVSVPCAGHSAPRPARSLCRVQAQASANRKVCQTQTCDSSASESKSNLSRRLCKTCPL